MNKARKELPRSAEEILRVLSDGDEITFEFPKEYKKGFRRQIERINRSEALFSRRGLFSKVMANAYFIYRSFLNFLISSKNKELDNALLVYMTSWRYIESFHGEDVSEDMIKVTYKGRKMGD